MEKVEHARTQNKLVVVFESYVLDHTSAIWVVLQLHSSLAATSLCCVFTLTISFINTAGVRALTVAVQVTIVPIVLSNPSSKTNVPGISVVENPCCLKIIKHHCNLR